MMTAKELKEVSVYSKTKQEAKIFLPIVEKINQKILENASLGYFSTSYVDCVELQNSFLYAMRKTWGCLDKEDFHAFLRKYYGGLGYNVIIYGDEDIIISWKD